MADAAGGLTAKNEGNRPVPRREPSPFDRLRGEIDRLFDDFRMAPWRSAFRSGIFDAEPSWRPDWRPDTSFGKVPPVDIAETAQGYEITAELPGMDEKTVEVKFVNGTLTIKGEKADEREEKDESYYLRERNYGSFQRAFRVPDGVDPDKVEASFRNGVLTIKLPKTMQAQKTPKRIEIRHG